MDHLEKRLKRLSGELVSLKQLAAIDVLTPRLGIQLFFNTNHSKTLLRQLNVGHSCVNVSTTLTKMSNIITVLYLRELERTRSTTSLWRMTR